LTLVGSPKRKNPAEKKKPTAYFTHLFFSNPQFQHKKNKRVKFPTT